MRASIALVFVVALFAAGQADLVDDLKEQATTLASGLIDQLKSAAKGILSSLITTIGKRDATPILTHARELFNKFIDLVHKGKQLSTGAFGKAVNKLKAISDKFHDKLASIKDAKEANKAVDAVVDEHKVEQKRFLEDLIKKAKDKAQSTWDKFIRAHTGHRGADVSVGKRTTLSEHLQNIGGAISSAVEPFKDIVAGLGNTLKGHFSNLVDTVKGHVNTLKGKLSGHVDDLKAHGTALLEHGKNALGALSEAVSDILKQTLSNAKPAIDGIANTVNGAADVIGKHLTGADQAF